MVQGDITEENTEAIINPTDNKFSLDGAISKKLSKREDSKFQATVPNWVL